MSSHADRIRASVERQDRAAAPGSTRRSWPQRSVSLAIEAQLVAAHRRQNGRPVQLRKAEESAKTPPGGMLAGLAAAGAKLFGHAPKAPNRNGLPDRLKAGVEALSGLAMDDVRVHRNSSEPARLGALAYTRGSDIHLGPGQEQHLPHEAWHVVQQKEGRVKATAQMKGAAINDDAGLEAEADRMGEQAGTAPPARPPAQLRHVTTRAVAVQGKIAFRGDDLVIPRTGASDAMTMYIRRDQKYLMRDDWSKSRKGAYGNDYKGPAFDQVGFFDTHFHLLDISKKYLIGEKHFPNPAKAASSRWFKETAEWSRANKMSELYMAIPPTDTANLYSVNLPHDRLALESTHPGLLADLVILNEYLKTLCSDKMLQESEGDRGPIKIVTALMRPNLANVERAYESYRAFRRGYKPDLANERQKKIFAFTTALFETHRRSFDRLKGLLDDLEKAPDIFEAVGRFIPRLLKNPKLASAGKPAASGFGSSASARMLERNFEELRKLKAFVPALIGPLLEINDIRDRGEKAALTTLVGGARADTALWDVALKATFPARERAMIQNIAAAPAPLLVQLGDAHVSPVARRVANSIAVPLPMSLRAVTFEPITLPGR